MADPTVDIDFEVRRGRFQLRAELVSDAQRLAIVGPSGAGKSTLLRVLAGLEDDAIGRVGALGKTWQDTEAGVWVPPWKRRVGWVPQRGLLFPHRDVRANLVDGAADASPQPIAEMLDIGALLDRRPRNLSGGERQRVALGRALLSRPQLLLLDEPFSALDRALRSDIADAVLDYCRTHSIPMVLISHDERDVERIAEQVWEVAGGALGRLA